MTRQPQRLADLLPQVVADLTARHHLTNGAPPPMTNPDAFVLRLTEAVRTWTEDPDRCDMEGREDEVARALLHVFAAELNTISDELDRSTAHLVEVGAHTQEQADAARAVTFGLRARASQLSVAERGAA